MLRFAELSLRSEALNPQPYTQDALAAFLRENGCDANPQEPCTSVQCGENPTIGKYFFGGP